jgi:hypothetical protein
VYSFPSAVSCNGLSCRNPLLPTGDILLFTELPGSLVFFEVRRCAGARHGDTRLVTDVGSVFLGPWEV